MDKVNYLLSMEIATVLNKDIEHIKTEIKQKIEKNIGEIKN